MANAKAVDTLKFLLDETKEEGIKAYWRGKAQNENPYSEADKPRYHAAWKEGWVEAQCDDETGV